MRLIDADVIPWDVDGVGFIPVIGKDEIDAMPEAVVRCKDCKHISQCGVDDWFFCADGKRREDGQTD